MIWRRSLTRLRRVVAINEEYVAVANANNGGSLIYYHYNGTELTYAKTYVPDDIDKFDDLGESLALNEDNFYVAGNTGEMEGRNGTAYAGNLKVEGWVRQKLVPEKRADDFVDKFGQSVAINHNQIIAIGAPDDDHFNGSVYVFGHQGDWRGWAQTQKLTVPRKPNSWFG